METNSTNKNIKKSAIALVPSAGAVVLIIVMNKRKYRMFDEE